MADEDYTPRYVGDTANALKVTFTDHSGTAYSLAGLTGSAFSLKLYNVDTQQTITGTGSWTITDEANGIAQYTWDADDVSTPGMYDIVVGVTFADGPLHFDPKRLEILPLPS